jgi:hypothetical protein
LEKSNILYLKKHGFLSSKNDLCQVLLKLVQWFSRSRKCEKFTDGQTDDGQPAIRKAYSGEFKSFRVDGKCWRPVPKQIVMALQINSQRIVLYICYIFRSSASSNVNSFPIAYGLTEKSMQINRWILWMSA